MTFTQQIRHRFLTFLKNHLNLLSRKLIAQSSRGPFAIVRPIGRRSGKTSETPIVVERVNDGFVFELTYGLDVGWDKNVQAAGSFTVRWHRKEYMVSKIEPLDAERGRAAFPQPVRLISKQHFFKMLAQP